MTTEVEDASYSEVPGAEVIGSSGVEFSAALSNIAKALIRAQLSMDEVFKDSTNPHFRSKYAGLPACLNAVKPALLANGIALLQPATSSDDGVVVYVTTMFLHESGEWMRCRLGLRPVKDDPQGAGSAITYGRRYTLLGMCGVAPEEDDDGNAASRRTRQQPSETRDDERTTRSSVRGDASRGADASPPGRGSDEPGTRDLNAPGSVSEKSAAAIASKLAILGSCTSFDLATLSVAFNEATRGRLDGSSELRLLSENEARRLYRLLAPIADDYARAVEVDRPGGDSTDEIPL